MKRVGKQQRKREDACIDRKQNEEKLKNYMRAFCLRTYLQRVKRERKKHVCQNLMMNHPRNRPLPLTL